MVPDELMQDEAGVSEGGRAGIGIPAFWDVFLLDPSWGATNLYPVDAYTSKRESLLSELKLRAIYLTSSAKAHRE